VPSDFAMSPRVAGGFPIFEACVVAGHLQPAKFQKAVQRPTSGTVNVNGTPQNAQADGFKNPNFLDKFLSYGRKRSF